MDDVGDRAGALSGLRVVDFGVYVAGPLLGMLLADAGAEVVHVARPGGPQRASDAVLHRSKHCVELDLASTVGADAAHRLIDGADVVVENFRPGVMDRLGFGPEASIDRNPGLVYCSLPGFPADDPRASLRGWEQTVSAATSIYRPPREHGPGGPELTTVPAILPVPLASAYAAIIGAGAVVAALIARERDGCGQHVTSSLYDAAFEIVGHEFLQASLRGPSSGFKPPTRAGTGHYLGSDGRWIHLCLFDDRHLLWFGREFAPELAADGWFDADVLRADPGRADELKRRVAGIIATRPAGDWERMINERSGAPAAVCQTQADWLHDEHAHASRAVVELADPVLGATVQLGTPVLLDRTPLSPTPRRPGPPPAWAAADSRPPAAPSTAPLDGIAVVDFTQVLAGPTCARVLAEYGATVVKVNKPTDRGIPWHAWINRGKHSILLDVGAPAARPVVERLMAGADVVSQNFARGVADRLGIGEADARRLNPDVVYSSISAFGPTGFRAAWRGREELGQSVTGLQHLWASDTGEPQMNLFPVSDIGTGHLAAFGVLLALYHRARTGRTQSVHASLAHTATAVQASEMVDFDGRVWDLPAGQHTVSLGPSDRLFAGSDGRWFSLVAEGAMTADDAAADLSLADMPAADAVARSNAAGHTAHLLLTGTELPVDPLVLARGNSTGDNVGVVRRLARTPAPALHAATRPGIDGRAVLERIGMGHLWASLVAGGAIVDVADSG